MPDTHWQTTNPWKVRAVEAGNTCYPTELTPPWVLVTVGERIKLVWMSRNTGEQNKPLASQKRLKTAVWKKTRDRNSVWGHGCHLGRARCLWLQWFQIQSCCINTYIKPDTRNMFYGLGQFLTLLNSTGEAFTVQYPEIYPINIHSNESLHGIGYRL